MEHIPVLLEEVITLLNPKPGGRYIDGTVGAGGHTRAILDAAAPDGHVLALDRDPEALDYARRQLVAYGRRVTFVNSSFARLAEVALEHGYTDVDGILLDLGLSSRQLSDPERGFSFLQEGPLDMRFDPRSGESAADLVNNLGAEELADIFRRYGEEQRSRHIARLIVAHRPIETTTALASLIESDSAPTIRRSRGGRHPATKVFQALRIAVNAELEEIEHALAAAVTLLRPGGRLAVISFHSLEDRLVKQFFRQQAQDCVCPPDQPICTCEARASLRLVTRKAVQPRESEVAVNPRSRSARLRVVERIDNRERSER